jgi:AAA ATPase domain
MSSLAMGHGSPSTGRRLHVLGSERAAPGTLEGSLIERDVELAVLEDAVGRLADGRGGVVVLEAPSGHGKTVLLDYAAGLALGAGCLVRRAAPGSRDRDFSFGVMRTLLDAPVREVPEPERARLCAGAAARAATVLLDGSVPAGGDAMLAHSVLWLCAGIAARRSLVLIVDDAHFSDRASLEVLSHLARRIDELPMLIAIGTRPEQPGTDTDLLTLVAARAARHRHRPPDVGGRCPGRLGTPSPTADGDRRGGPDPPGRTRYADQGLPRLPRRHRRKPVAAHRAEPPDRRQRSRGIDGPHPGRRADARACATRSDSASPS